MTTAINTAKAEMLIRRSIAEVYNAFESMARGWD